MIYRTKIAILYTDAGYGHVATANVLKNEIEKARGWEVVLIDLYREPFAVLDPYLRIFRTAGPDIYNGIVIRRGHTTIFWPCFAALSQLLCVLGLPAASRRLAITWRNDRFDLVLSVMPLVNHIISSSIIRSRKRIPFVTVVTEMYQVFPYVWLQASTQHVICGTDMLAEQARRFGLHAAQIHQTSGLPISSSFRNIGERRCSNVFQADFKRQIGLSEKLLTGFMMFGGRGANRMYDYARRIDQSDLAVQMIYACGSNAELADRIKALPARRPRVVLQLRQDLHDYMAASDFYIGKPGAGSISEALAIGLPLILELNHKTMFQEYGNVRWVKRHSLGVSFRNATNLIGAIRRICERSYLSRAKAATVGLRNAAASEIPEILDLVIRNSRAFLP